MNIDEYRCNMNVLVGLFLVNDISFNAFVGAFLYEGGIDFIDFNITNPLMNFNLRFVFKEGHTNVYISKKEPDRTIYEDVTLNAPNPYTFESYLTVFLP